MNRVINGKSTAFEEVVEEESNSFEHGETISLSYPLATDKTRTAAGAVCGPHERFYSGCKPTRTCYTDLSLNFCQRGACGCRAGYRIGKNGCQLDGTPGCTEEERRRSDEKLYGPTFDSFSDFLDVNEENNE